MPEQEVHPVGEQRTAITVARGDGIGPEIMDATLRVLEAAGASLDIEEISIGEPACAAGDPAGISSSAVDSLRRTKVFLKAPSSTPQGGGFKSLKVTVRKMFGMYANVRRCVAYAPFVPTQHPGMDVVFVREVEEDLYAGVEHRQTDEVVQCLRLLTRSGCERIVRYAFEYARRNGRTTVSAFSKDDILKLTDGLFHRVFDEVAAEYPDIEAEHALLDTGAVRLVADPTSFDVVVLPSLYGDLLSDVAAQLAGSVGLVYSVTAGDDLAMFEAIHGSAPRRAGQDKANPSGLLLGAVEMLVHLGQVEVATTVHDAWLRTIEDGVRTYDIVDHGHPVDPVGTAAFADAVVERLGERPQHLPSVVHRDEEPLRIVPTQHPRAVKVQVGVDVFVNWDAGTPADLAALLRAQESEGLRLEMVTSRGQKVWPDGAPETLTGDHWRCRFSASGAPVSDGEVVGLYGRLIDTGLAPIKTEGLFTFDGVPGFSKGQGQ